MVFYVSILLFGLIAYTYAIYPLVLYLLARRTRSGSTRARPLQTWPELTIMVTGHNIESLIAAKLENLSQLKYDGTIKLVFVLDGCTDGSQQIVKTLSKDRFPFPVSIAASPTRIGKEAAIRQAMASINSEIIVFSDADASLQADAVKRLVKRLQEPGVGAVSGREIHDKLSNDGASEGQGLFYHYEEFIKEQQEKVTSLCYVQGGNFAVWRHLYPQNIPAGATQDGIIAFDVIRHGYRVAYEKSAISHEPYSLSNQEDFWRRVRTVSRAFFSVLARWRILLPNRHGWFGFHLLSARVLRWLSLPMAIVALVLGLIAGPDSYRTLLMVGSFSWLVTCAHAYYQEQHGQRSRLSYFIFYFSYIHLAAALAVGRVLLGHRTTVWQPSNQ